jgi:endonuclease YncB( thermonuclease family)
MWKQTIAALTVALAIIGLAQTADTATCAGVSMPDTKTIDGTTLKLNGMGIREATMFSVNVYVAGLYVEDKSDDGSALASADGKKHLVLHFVRGVDKSKIVDAYRESFNSLSSSGMSSEIEKLLGWMTSVENGDEQVYTYIPGDGLAVEVKGSKKGTIEGSDFAETFFKIWLGPNPPNAGLKRGLLGGACG